MAQSLSRCLHRAHSLSSLAPKVPRLELRRLPIVTLYTPIPPLRQISISPRLRADRKSTVPEAPETSTNSKAIVSVSGPNEPSDPKPGPESVSDKLQRYSEMFEKYFVKCLDGSLILLAVAMAGLVAYQMFIDLQLGFGPPESRMHVLKARIAAVNGDFDASAEHWQRAINAMVEAARQHGLEEVYWLFHAYMQKIKATHQSSGRDDATIYNLLATEIDLAIQLSKLGKGGNVEAGERRLSMDSFRSDNVRDLVLWKTYLGLKLWRGGISSLSPPPEHGIVVAREALRNFDSAGPPQRKLRFLSLAVVGHTFVTAALVFRKTRFYWPMLAVALPLVVPHFRDELEKAWPPWKDPPLRLFLEADPEARRWLIMFERYARNEIRAARRIGDLYEFEELDHIRL